MSKDAVKETLADVMGPRPSQVEDARRWSRALGAAAAEVVWTVLRDSPEGGIVEGVWLRDMRKFVVAGMERAGVHIFTEVWCDVPPDLARSRFTERVRQRHPTHLDDLPGSEDRWRTWTAAAEPLGIGAVYRVDTSGAVELAPLISYLKKVLSST
jgi:glucokinase